MDVILVMVQLLDLDARIVFMDVGDHSAQIFENARLLEDFPAVFGRKDEVIVTVPDAMMITVVYASHASSVAHVRGRG